MLRLGYRLRPMPPENEVKIRLHTARHWRRICLGLASCASRPPPWSATRLYDTSSCVADSRQILRFGSMEADRVITAQRYPAVWTEEVRSKNRDRNTNMSTMVRCWGRFFERAGVSVRGVLLRKCPGIGPDRQFPCLFANASGVIPGAPKLRSPLNGSCDARGNLAIRESEFYNGSVTVAFSSSGGSNMISARISRLMRSGNLSHLTMAFRTP